MTLKIRPNAIEQDCGPFTFPGVRLPNDGLHILDTDDSHHLIISPGSNLSADRVLTITTGDAARTITLSGDPTLGDWFDQGVKQASSPTFAALTITNNIIVGGTVDGVDVAGANAAEYVTISLDGNIANERVITAGTGISITDNGAGNTVVIAIDEYGIDHGGLSGLGDDDHTIYFLADGSRQLDGDLDFTGPQAITTTSGDLTISPADQVYITTPVGIGIASPDGTLHVHTATAGAVTAHADADDLIVENSDNVGLTLLCPADKAASIYFGDLDNNTGMIQYFHGSRMDFTVETTLPLRLLTTDIRGFVPIKMQERAAAVADTAGYGQLWIKTATPNQLWFTDDAGNDVAGLYLGALAFTGATTISTTAGDLTISPASNLHLQNKVAVTSTIFGGSGAGADTYITFRGGGASHVMRAFTNGTLYFDIAGGEALVYRIAGGSNGILNIAQAAVVINEDSNDTDFRVESDGNAYMLFVDGGTNRVGIGRSGPDGTLHVQTATAGSVTANAAANDLVVEHDGDGGISILSTATSDANIFFGSPTRNYRGGIRYDHSSDILSFRVAETIRVMLDVNSFDFQQATTISTTTGSLKLDSVDSYIMLDSGTGYFYLEYVGDGSSRLYLRSDENDVSANVAILYFVGLNDAAQDVNYATIAGNISDETDGTEDGSLYFYVMSAGVTVNAMRLVGGGAEGPAAVYYNTTQDQPWDIVFRKYMRGKNDAAQNVIYAEERVYQASVVDGTEHGDWRLYIMKSGTLRNAFSVNYGTTVFNEEGQDINVRVESDSYPNMLYVDAGANFVSIGTATLNSIAYFSNSGVIFNDEGLNRDFRVETGGGTHVLFVNDADDRLEFSRYLPAGVFNTPQSATVLTLRKGAATIADGTGPKMALRVEDDANVEHWAGGFSMAYDFTNDLSDLIFQVRSGAGDTFAVTEVLRANSTRTQLAVPLFIKEAAAAVASIAGFGTLWVRDDAPNTLMFTDDAGNHYTVDLTPV